MIRKYQKSDLDALMQIWLEGNLDAHDFIDPGYWHDNYELVKKELPNAQLYVDEEEGEIAGFVGMQDDYIAGIFVKRDHRGRGIGGKLIDFLKLKHDKLQLSVYEKNEAAISFYQNRGFKLVKKEIDQETGAADCLMEWDA